MKKKHKFKRKEMYLNVYSSYTPTKDNPHIVDLFFQINSTKIILKNK